MDENAVMESILSVSADKTVRSSGLSLRLFDVVMPRVQSPVPHQRRAQPQPRFSAV